MKAIKMDRLGDWLFSESGQGQSEYILMVFCLSVVIFGLQIFNLVLNKAYLDAVNRIRKW